MIRFCIPPNAWFLCSPPRLFWLILSFLFCFFFAYFVLMGFISSWLESYAGIVVLASSGYSSYCFIPFRSIVSFGCYSCGDYCLVSFCLAFLYFKSKMKTTKGFQFFFTKAFEQFNCSKCFGRITRISSSNRKS